MDDIFKKTTSIFNAAPISVKEPYRYDKHGNLKPEFLEEAIRRESTRRESQSVHIANEKADSDESDLKPESSTT